MARVFLGFGSAHLVLKSPGIAEHDRKGYFKIKNKRKTRFLRGKSQFLKANRRDKRKNKNPPQGVVAFFKK
jgi:hypothetical protein